MIKPDWRAYACDSRAERFVNYLVAQFNAGESCEALGKDYDLSPRAAALIVASWRAAMLLDMPISGDEFNALAEGLADIKAGLVRSLDDIRLNISRPVTERKEP